MLRRILPLLVAVLALTACAKKKSEPAPTTGASKSPPSGVQHALTDLTVRQLMQGPGIVGTSPSNPRFSADGRFVFFDWNAPARLDSMNATAPLDAYEHWLDLKKDEGTYRLELATRRIEKLADAVADTTAPDEFAWDHARDRRGEIRHGDVYLVDASTGRARRITATVAREKSIQISPDGKTAYFRRGDDLFSVAWSGGPLTQVTNLALKDDPKDKKLTAQRQYLVDEQKALFDEFKDHGDKKKKENPPVVYLGSGYEIQRLLVSPSGRYVAVGLNHPATDVRRPLVPLVVTESGYVETEEARSKVGDAQDATSVVFVDLKGDSVVQMKIEGEMDTDALSWSPTEDRLLVRGLTNDWHDRYFMIASPDDRGPDGKVAPHVLDRFHDDAWVGGPSFYETGAWMPDGKAIYFISEADKWGHLYTVSTSGRRTQLTHGSFEVYGAWPDPKGSRWFVISNEGRPGSQRLWEMKLDGSDRRLVTPEIGDYTAAFSGDMKHAAVLYSTLTHPDELYLLDADAATLDGPLTQSTTEVYRSYPWRDPETLSFKANDGASVPAQVFRPEDFGGKPNGAGVVFIHGAGYLQNVIDGWGYYYREFMFNTMLAAHGYTVLNVDYRGSAGYGRDCRVAIYKHMGGRDLDDIIDGAHYLERNDHVGTKQVGVYGGSYGGFLTLMAMFKYPDDITSGSGLRSVTDWAQYNHWYTVRILGLPSEDPEAYKRSSPIYFASGLKGHLLMLHGLRDDNVLAEDILRLSQRLIELGKQDWQLQLYPVESHGFERASSWTDEYRRTYKLFNSTLPDGAAGK